MMTKVAIRDCQDCTERIMILCSENSQIIAVRCPKCYKKFKLKNKKFMKNGPL